MCSQGAFGGALRCPEYAKDLPRPELIEVLQTQFIRRGFSIDVPADAYDETRWNRDEVAVFFQSGGSVKPRCTLLVEAGINHPDDPAAAQAAPPPRQKLDGAVASADEAERAADMSIPTVRLSLEGRMLRAELLKAQEQAAESADAHVGPPQQTAPANAAQPVKAIYAASEGDDRVLRVVSTGKESPSTVMCKQDEDEEELMGWAGF